MNPSASAESVATSSVPRLKDGFFWSLATIQIAIFILYILFVDHPNAADVTGTDSTMLVVTDFPVFENIHIITFVGFGFLMVYIRKYSFTGVGVNLLLGAIAIQWGILCNNFFTQAWDSSSGSTWAKFTLTITNLINGDFAACAVAISMGAVLGKVSHLQLVWMAVIEVVCFALNRVLVFQTFHAVDQGGCMYIHTFAAFFGLGFSRFINHFHPELRDADVPEDKNQSSTYHSDLFALIGTVFLFVLFPSFNSALLGATLADRHRVIVNTVLALCASNVTAFAFSHFLRGEDKLNMRDVQNATLAGTVTISSASAVLVHPWGAILLGFVGGALAILGSVYIRDFMWTRLGFHDSRGVFWVHGIPGIVGGVAGAIASVMWSSDTTYSENIAVIFSARAIGGRTSGLQAAFQMAALGSSVGIGFAGGVLSALVLGSQRCSRPKPTFTEASEWQVPDEETPFYYGDGAVKRRMAAGLSPLTFE